MSDSTRNGVVSRVVPYSPRHTPNLRHPSVRLLIKGHAARVRVVRARGIAACRGRSDLETSVSHGKSPLAATFLAYLAMEHVPSTLRRP